VVTSGSLTQFLAEAKPSTRANLVQRFPTELQIHPVLEKIGWMCPAGDLNNIISTETAQHQAGPTCVWADET